MPSHQNGQQSTLKRLKTLHETKSIATFHEQIRESLDEAWSRLPKVKPLNLSLLSKEIGNIIRQQRKSCQNFSIVSSPRARKQGARLSVENDKRLVEHLKEVDEKFEKNKEQRLDKANAKWQQVQYNFCIDFASQRIQKERQERSKRFKLLIQDIIEQSKLIRDRRFPLDLDFVRESGLFPTEPYQRGEVKNFLRQVKLGNLLAVANMVKKDPLIVFQFDEMKQTGLIWAVKRNKTLIARFLLKHFSRVNFKDEAGRTALNFAV